MGREQLVKDLVTSDYRKGSKLVTSDLVTKRNRRGYSANEARNKAMELASKLNNPSRLRFYLKCAWNLTDDYLDRLLNIAKGKTDPVRYFSYSAANEMRLNG